MLVVIIFAAQAALADDWSGIGPVDEWGETIQPMPHPYNWNSAPGHIQEYELEYQRKRLHCRTIHLGFGKTRTTCD